MPASYRIAALPGDGVGPEVTKHALAVLRASAGAHDATIEVEELPVGWAAVQSAGSPLPEPTLEACLAADAVFLGAVGHPDASDAPSERRPEAGLLALRSELGCHTNLRPLRVMEPLVGVSPLDPDRIRGVDFLIVRELAGGLYYGRPRGRSEESGVRSAYNTLRYDESEVARVAEQAFGMAEARRGRVVSVDKANVLETSRLWREVVDEVAAAHPDVRCEHMLVDRAAMELVLHPSQFDVILTENLFGDILSDEAAGVAGSLGLLPSASVGGTTPLFEPVHGSAPDQARRDAANPTGAILSAAMLLDHGLGLSDAARTVERAVEAACRDGFRTADVAGTGNGAVGATRFTEAVLERLAAPEASVSTRAGPEDAAGRS